MGSFFFVDGELGEVGVFVVVFFSENGDEIFVSFSEDGGEGGAKRTKFGRFDVFSVIV